MRKKFRPKVKQKRLQLLLALLITAATGAWADDTYTVAGDNAAMFGSVWDPTSTANDMTKNGDGTYSITYTNVYLDADVQYRVMKDHSWSEAYPDGNRVINIAEAGTYTLTIHFNPTTHEVYETMPGSGSGEEAPTTKHLITATYDKQTRLLEQPLPYETTVGVLYEAVTGEPFSDLLTTMADLEMTLTGISSTKTDVVSIGEFTGASTTVTVNADGKATVALRFGNFAQGIFVSVVPPLYVTMKDGTKDAAKWTATVGTNSNAQTLPVGGLSNGDAVTLTYGGRLKVKNVTATTDAKPDPLATPLTVEAVTPGTIVVNMTGTLSTGMKYSVNGDTPTLITTTTDITVAKGDKVQFYGNGTQTQAYGDNPEVSIQGSGAGFQTKVYGNIMSLLDETDYATNYTDLPNAEYVFYKLFKENTTLIDASELLLPATTLASSCYFGMFIGCTNLTKAPKLPATVLANYCYKKMFYGCTSLTSAYVKAAYSVSVYECDQMFNGCTATGAVLHTTSDSKDSWEDVMGTGKTWPDWTVADDWED